MGYRFGSGVVAHVNDVDTGHFFDLDGDGHLDVVCVVAELPYPNEVGDASGVMWLDGSDRWQTRHSIVDPGTFTKLEGLVVGDFDGDGINEIAVADQEGQRIVIIKPPGGDYTAPAPWPWVAIVQVDNTNLYSWPHDCTTFDLDVDGRPELVFSTEGGTGTTNGGVFWADCQGDALIVENWTIRTIRQHPGSWSVCDRLGDWSGSGRGDLLFGSRKNRNALTQPGIFIAERPVDPTTEPWPLFATIENRVADWLHVDFGDFSGDGNDLDVIGFDSGLSGVSNFGAGRYRFSTDWTYNAFPAHPASSQPSYNIRRYRGAGPRDDAVYVVANSTALLYHYDINRGQWVTYGAWRTNYPHPSDGRLQIGDLWGSGAEEIGIFDSGGNKVHIARPYV